MAALQLQTSIIIPAPVDAVWQVLVDWTQYPDWNPFITQMEGQLVLGHTLTAHIDNMVFHPTITTLEPPYQFSWLGKLWFKGLFDGEHQFLLEPLPNGHTQFHHRESFRGLLVPLFKKQLLGKTKQGFEGMNQALKQRVTNINN